VRYKPFCMETHERRLTFPQRNWLLLCFITAIIVAVAYYLIDTGTHDNTQQNEIQTSGAPANISSGGDTSNAHGIPPDSLKH
jgi:hypothetical protein